MGPELLFIPPVIFIHPSHSLIRFLLAQLYLDSLIGKWSPRAIRSELKELATGSNTYDLAYDKAMQRIQDQITDRSRMAVEALAWITCAKRPLTTVELRNALAVELGEPQFYEDNLPDLDDIISACAGLVTVGSSDIIRLVHYTTKEYFERTWTRWFPDAHNSIASTCLTYLSFNVFQAGICLTDTDFEARLDEYPLYSYAARNWGYHARMQPINESLTVAFLGDTPKVDACVQAIFAFKGHLSYGDYSRQVPLGFTRLHLAAYYGLTSVARSLIQHCDESHVRDSMGRTPLTWAAFAGHVEIVKFFLDIGIDACDRDDDGQTPITLAASMGWVGVVSLLLQNGVHPDLKDVAGQTSLSWAAYRGHKNVVKLLLEKGADPESTDLDGLTPLSWAASNGWVEIVTLLLERPVNIDCKDIHGRSPLSWAAESGHTAVAKLLLKKGAQPDLKDAEGHDPLFYAAHHKNEAVVRLIQKRYEDNIPHAPLADQITLKCPLCLHERPLIYHMYGTLRRHIKNRHYPRFRYRCSDPHCVDYLTYRRDMISQHMRRRHNQSPLHLGHLRQQEPLPQSCPVCQSSVSSWKEFYSCVLSHARDEGFGGHKKTTSI